MITDIFHFTSPITGSSLSGSEHRYMSLETDGVSTNNSKIFGYTKIVNPTYASPPSNFIQLSDVGTTSGTNYDELTLTSIPLTKLGFNTNSYKSYFSGRLYASFTTQGAPRSVIDVTEFSLRPNPENINQLLFRRQKIFTQGQAESQTSYSGTYSFKIGTVEHLFTTSETTNTFTYTNDSYLQIRAIQQDSDDTQVYFQSLNISQSPNAFTGKLIYKGIIYLI